MEPENLLPFLQLPAADCCSKPDESSSHPHVLFLSDQFWSHLSLGVRKVSLSYALRVGHLLCVLHTTPTERFKSGHADRLSREILPGFPQSQQTNCSVAPWSMPWQLSGTHFTVLFIYLFICSGLFNVAYSRPVWLFIPADTFQRISFFCLHILLLSELCHFHSAHAFILFTSRLLTVLLRGNSTNVYISYQSFLPENLS